MKRLTALLLTLALIPALCGCSTVYTNYREMEQLLVLQTMGVDHADSGGVVLSLASGSASGKRTEPVRLRMTGATIATALSRAQNYSFEESLFFSHMDAVVLGEEYAKRGTVDCVDYICQSPRLRMDMPIYIVKGGTAETALLNTGDDSAGISELLRGVREYYDVRGDGSVYTVSDFARDTLRHGAALICALELTPSVQQSSAEQQSTTALDEGADTEGSADSADSTGTDSASAASVGERLTAAAAGYAVMRDMKLCAYIGLDDALGVSFLKNTVGQSDIVVTDRHGDNVTLEINDGGCKITPRWASDGTLSRIDIAARADATVLEADGTANFAGAEYTDHLTAQLESYISERISRILRLAGALEADFVGLGAAIEQSSPINWAVMSAAFPSMLASLEVRVTVNGQITHTNDTRRTVKRGVNV